MYEILRYSCVTTELISSCSGWLGNGKANGEMQTLNLTTVLWQSTFTLLGIFNSFLLPATWYHINNFLLKFSTNSNWISRKSSQHHWILCWVWIMIFPLPNVSTSCPWLGHTQSNIQSVIAAKHKSNMCSCLQDLPQIHHYIRFSSSAYLLGRMHLAKWQCMVEQSLIWKSCSESPVDILLNRLWKCPFTNDTPGVYLHVAS